MYVNEKSACFPNILNLDLELIRILLVCTVSAAQCALHTHSVHSAHGEIVRRAIFANELPTATDDMGASCASVNKCIFVNYHLNAATDDGEKINYLKCIFKIKSV